jgi:hypothetical protein
MDMQKKLIRSLNFLGILILFLIIVSSIIYYSGVVNLNHTWLLVVLYISLIVVALICLFIFILKITKNYYPSIMYLFNILNICLFLVCDLFIVLYVLNDLNIL